MNKNVFNYPAYAGWDVTGNCNHKCFYCYNYWRTECAEYPEQSGKTYSEIADFFLSKKPAVVIISGGEPLIVFDEIKEQIIRFYNSGVHIRIFTNASLITEGIANFCKEYNISLMVSFPSVNRELFGKITNNNNTYDSVIKGMDLLRDYGVYFTPNVVVSKMNLSDFEETAKWLINRYHPKKLFISRVTRPANATDVYDKFTLDKNDLTTMFLICERLKKQCKIEISGCGGTPFCIFPSKESLKMFGKSCGAGKNSYCLDMSGNVRACSRDSESVGNIFKDDFETIREKLISWGDRTHPPDKCKNCKVLSVCAGGCRMTNLDYLRNGKAIDCDADPDKAPKSLPKHVIRIIPWKNYILFDDLKFLWYQNVCRVSHLYHMAYFERKFADYIKNNKQINLLKVIKDLNVSYSTAKSFIAKLLYAGLVNR